LADIPSISRFHFRRQFMKRIIATFILMTAMSFAQTEGPAKAKAVAKSRLKASAVTSGTFGDGTMATFSVGAPWWSWFWLGLFYQPARGQLDVFKNVQVQRHKWWCLWLCTETVTESRGVNADALTIRALGFSGVPAGEQDVDAGFEACTNCSSLTHYVHNFGFPAPPWAGGGGFKGIGFRGSATYKGPTLILHDHWGTDKTQLGAPAFPPDFQ
jgi:hypothetical protein